MSFYAVCEEETEERKESRDRKKERRKEEYPCVCSFLKNLAQSASTSVSTVASLYTKKNRLRGRGLLLEREYRLAREREAGRQAEKQRERAGVGNPPLHLLVIYSFMFSRRLAR